MPPNRRARFAPMPTVTRAEASSAAPTSIGFDEDALPGQSSGGVDHAGGGGAAAPTPGCRRRPGRCPGTPFSRHVGDAVLELDEHVGAVVEAQAVARAEVLVDPHPHVESRLPGTSIPSPGAPRPARRQAHPRHRRTATPAPSSTTTPGSLDRDDPDTLAYLKAENAYADAWFEPLGRPARGAVRRDQAADPGDRPVGAGAQGAVALLRPHGGGPVVPGPLPAAGGRRRRDGRAGPARRERRGRRARLLRPRRLRRQPRPRPLAWSIDVDGGEEYTLRFRDLATGRDLPDTIERTYYGTAWSADGRHLFYVKPDAAMRPYQVWRHALGTGGGRRRLGVRGARRAVLRRAGPDPQRGLRRHRRREQDHQRGRGWCPPPTPLTPPAVIEPRQAGQEYTIDHRGDRFVILTNVDAEDFRIMTAPVATPGRARLDRAGGARARAGGSSASTPSPGTCSCTSGPTACPGCGSCSTTAPSGCWPSTSRCTASSPASTPSSTPPSCASTTSRW